VLQGQLTLFKSVLRFVELHERQVVALEQITQLYGQVTQVELTPLSYVPLGHVHFPETRVLDEGHVEQLLEDEHVRQE